MTLLEKAIKTFGFEDARTIVIATLIDEGKGELAELLYDECAPSEEEDEEEVYNLEMMCVFCRKTHSVKVKASQFEAWQNGELIQNAMPDLSPTEREQLISRICPKCQMKVFDPF